MWAKALSPLFRKYFIRVANPERRVSSVSSFDASLITWYSSIVSVSPMCSPWIGDAVGFGSKVSHSTSSSSSSPSLYMLPPARQNKESCLDSPSLIVASASSSSSSSISVMRGTSTVSTSSSSSSSIWLAWNVPPFEMVSVINKGVRWYRSKMLW